MTTSPLPPLGVGGEGMIPKALVPLEKTLAKVLQYFASLSQEAVVLSLYIRLEKQMAPFTDARTYASIISSLLKCGHAGIFFYAEAAVFMQC